MTCLQSLRYVFKQLHRNKKENLRLMERNEARHILRMKNGDEKSFRWIYGQYHVKIYHYCFKFIRQKELVDEIVSDIFVKLWAKRMDLDNHKSVGGLLHKIARDYCIDQLRKTARSAELRNSFLLHYEESLVNSIEHELHFEESLRAMDKVIDTLPPKRKLVFQMRYQNDMTNAKIADELDISPNTVKVHLAKACNFIRNYIFTHSDVVYILVLCLISAV